MSPEKIGGFERTTPAEPLRKETVKSIEEINRPPESPNKLKPKNGIKEVEKILLESPVAGTLRKRELKKLEKRIEKDLKEV